MALIRRVTRLFRADFHAVLDRVEEPGILLRQSIREMEEDLAHDEQDCRRHEREREQLSKRESELRQSLASLGEELGVCFAAEKEELARSLMRRKLETERSIRLLSRRQETLTARLDHLSQRVNENRSRYESMRQKAEIFDRRDRETDAEESWSMVDVRISDEDVEVALLKERQRRAGK